MGIKQRAFVDDVDIVSRKRKVLLSVRERSCEVRCEKAK
jgi:hypothetical protein